MFRAGLSGTVNSLDAPSAAPKTAYTEVSAGFVGDNN